ncbi:MAG: glycosyltransferase family 39 protein [Elusimicrobia bacterium]|nr:glycosyltransferase family 39 protein [Elusimicrobiota bacterium]
MPAQEHILRRGPLLGFLATLAAFLALRAPLLDYPYFGDDDFFVREALAPVGTFRGNGQPILFGLLLKAGMAVFGWEWLRLVPFLFSLGTLGFTWILGRRLLGTEKGLWAAGLLALSPWSVFVAAQLDIYGAVFALLVCGLCWFYWSWLEGGSLGSLVLAGLCFGLLWLSSLSASLVLVAIAAHCAQERGAKRAAMAMGFIFAVGLAMFSIYAVSFPGHFQLALSKGGGTLEGMAARLGSLSTPAGLRLYLNSFSKALIFMGPLFCWGLVSGLISKESRRRLALPLWLCLVYMAGICLLLNPHKLVIYWTAVLPLLAIITAASIERGEAARAAAWSAAFMAVLALLTWAGSYSVQPIHPRLNGSWEGLFRFLPVRIFFGPSLSFYVKPAAVLFAFIACAALALRGAKARASLIGLGLAYSLFYSVEYTYSALSPDLDRTGREVLAALSSPGVKPPIYLHGYGALACQKAGMKVDSFLYDAGEMPSLMARMEKSRGTVVIMNSPAIGSDAELKRFLADKAVLVRAFSDSGTVLAEIWELR